MFWKLHNFPASVVCRNNEKKHQQRQTIPINKTLEQEHFQNKFNYEKLVVGRFFSLTPRPTSPSFTFYEKLRTGWKCFMEKLTTMQSNVMERFAIAKTFN